MHIVETGYYTFKDVPAKKYGAYDVTYTKTYATAPFVIAFGSSLGCKLIASVGTRTKTGYKLQAYNPSDALATGDIRWIAFM